MVTKSLLPFEKIHIEENGKFPLQLETIDYKKPFKSASWYIQQLYREKQLKMLLRHRFLDLARVGMVLLLNISFFSNWRSLMGLKKAIANIAVRLIRKHPSACFVLVPSTPTIWIVVVGNLTRKMWVHHIFLFVAFCRFCR